MRVDRKKSIMRTFKVKSACGENQLGIFTRIGFTCYRQLTAVRLVSLINSESVIYYKIHQF